MAGISLSQDISSKMQHPLLLKSKTVAEPLVRKNVCRVHPEYQTARQRGVGLELRGNMLHFLP